MGGGERNTATGPFATIGGGGGVESDGNTSLGNTAGGGISTVSGGQKNAAEGFGATVGGGRRNTASGWYATVGGGGGFDSTHNVSFGNTAWGDASTVGGGQRNTADGFGATVGGGDRNQASGPYAAVGGGTNNQASGGSAVIPGGQGNIASGKFSVALGYFANARHKGAGVWSDASSNTRFASTAANQLSIRASGGVRIFSESSATVGVQLLPGDNAWSAASDATLKEDYVPVDKQQVLAGVQQLTIQNWKLKGQAGNVRHIGPIAQDFQAVFGVGADRRYINSTDADGVALVAIQALVEQNHALQVQVEVLQARLARMEQQLPGQSPQGE